MDRTYAEWSQAVLEAEDKKALGRLMKGYPAYAEKLQREIDRQYGFPPHQRSQIGDLGGEEDLDGDEGSEEDSGGD